jgi:hypothetical protein
MRIDVQAPRLQFGVVAVVGDVVSGSRTYHWAWLGA